MNIIDWMLTEKIAGHWKQAQNIIAGLHLNELYILNDYDGIKARARLYRDWRNAGEPSKVAYQKAIAGEPVPAPMFEDVLHAAPVVEPVPAPEVTEMFIAEMEICNKCLEITGYESYGTSFAGDEQIQCQSCGKTFWTLNLTKGFYPKKVQP